MSYYRPSQTLAMTRGRGGYSPRGSSYRGSRGSRGNYGSPRGFSSFDSRPKYSSSDRYSSSRSSKFDDYRKPFRDSYSSRDRSPDRKKPRVEGYSSRHDSSYGSYGSRYDSSFSERRSFSGDRAVSYPRREEFRRPSGPPVSSRGGYRGRGGSRGSRILRTRDRLPPRRRMIESSYGIRKRMISSRANDFTRRLKISRLRSAIAARRAIKSDDNDDSDGEKEDKKDSDKEDNEDEEDMSEKKSPKKEDSEKHDDKAQSDEGRPKKMMIKLNCPHCNVNCITFRRYERHLTSRSHMIAMKRVAVKQKAILSQMRQAQRSAQNELEKSSNEDLQGRTNFCPLCKLNYKQKKAVHQSSEAHKNMKKFLMPYCKVCRGTFKSPMIYESHCCSIEHLKRKQRMENEASEDSNNEEADLENFTTIDSVGDVDEEETEKKGESDVKETVNVGIEKIKKVDAHYCELCKMYLPRVDESEMSKIIAKHCKMLIHMRRYVRYKEDRALEERAQKLQKKEIAEKEEKAKKVQDDDVPSATAKKNKADKSDVKKDELKEDGDENEAHSKSIDDEENKDDKMWADVDKDLGEILADADDDDEEDSSAKTKERYDRFKLSEKNGDEILKDVKDEEKISNGQSEDVKEES
ncbi:hypothetical protein HHI36_018026 [Cryptolaemus montrouzieri]|uniref:Uncharacterized protein n=1 Tax=Cryptolaemus montrouzieri TaxID=559131 RepID=A0ABD2NZM7_9CUCU